MAIKFTPFEPAKDVDLKAVALADAAALKAKRAPKGTFDRAAYQRELMRKRRAAAREAK